MGSPASPPPPRRAGRTLRRGLRAALRATRDVSRRDEPPPWLRPHSGTGASPAVVAHLDFWLDPQSFAHRVNTNALDLKRPWTLAAGLNRPPDDAQHEFGLRAVLPGRRGLDVDREWTWGHDARTRRAARGYQRADAQGARGCAAWADLFYLPSHLRGLCPTLRDAIKFHHEVSVPTALRFLEVEGEGASAV